MSNKNIDEALDSVLKEVGSSMKLVTKAEASAMRKVIRKVMSSSYIAGSNSCDKIIREHYILVPRQAGRQ